MRRIAALEVCSASLSEYGSRTLTADVRVTGMLHTGGTMVPVPA